MILLQAFAILGAAMSASAVCDACFGGNCYTKTTIFAGLPINGQIAIDRSANTVYFHFQNSIKVDFNAYFDLVNLDFQLIPDLGFTFARAVDQDSHDVYLSGTTGIYKFFPSTKTVENIGFSNMTIFHMQYNKKLYYTKYDEPGLYIYENGVSTPISALSNYEIDQFVVDKKNDVYFRHNDFNIYRLKNGKKNATMFNDSEMYSLTTDHFGNVYLVQTAARGLFKVDYSKDNGELIDVGAFGSGIPFSVVFDNFDNVIYHDIQTEHLFYLTPNNGVCEVTSGQGSGKKMNKTVKVLH